jgi:hypothetical protein
MIVNLIIGLAAIGAVFQAPSASLRSCRFSPREDLLPGVIAPMASDRPIWFVDGAAGRWHGADYPVKSVWVIERDEARSLSASGRRLDGSGLMRFSKGMNGPRSDSVLIPDPKQDSMIPGGISAETQRRFVFVSSYLFYPSPGCWEIQVQMGAHQRSVRVLVE